ncbi:bZIP YAP Transcription Factor [Abortiporus biennis]
MATPQPALALPSSSSSTWATPSKEWVIPAKPKPGRKPKKDIPQPSADAEPDSKGRRVQNRAAQRAFRERKQSQLADLQARVQQYEQGEIERNVALQQIAKRLKEENEKLRSENIALQEKLAKVEQERDALRDNNKRSRDESMLHSPDLSDRHLRKRSKTVSDHMESLPPIRPTTMSYMSSPSSVSSPDSTNSRTSFSPMPVLPPPRDVPIFAQSNALNNIFDLISTSKNNLFEPGSSLDTFDCGFCSDNTPCVCRELAAQQVSERLQNSATLSSMKLDNLDQKPSVVSLSPASPQSATPSPPRSILDNLPAYQPPVPLRSRRNGNASINSVFPLSNSSKATNPTPSCSGDPSNCMACADDPFGKAFCAAISKSVATSSPCNDCPGQCQAGSSKSGCCGNPSLCGQSKPTVIPDVTYSDPSTVQNVGSSFSTNSDTIPCDDAWKQIKSHPNVAFADLELLAEVVARRSKCTGPRVEISPAPGTITPERGISPSLLPSRANDTALDNEPVLLTDPHAHYRERQLERHVTTPQGFVLSCGRSRVREVEADGVRDALRLLDAKYAIP